MESVLAAAITGMLTLLGVLVSNSRSRAVMEVKFEELTAEVEKHNHMNLNLNLNPPRIR